jgi:type II secretory pathway pseudopilin PulG
VKRCPTCEKIFTEKHLSFCVDDGTPLANFDPPDDEATVVRPAAGDSSSEPSGAPGERDSTPYQPLGSYTPPGSSGERKRQTWPWVLGIFALLFIVLVGLGIAAAVLLPRMMRASNTNANLNANVERRNNSNENLNSANSNSAESNANNSTEDDTTPPPADEAQVLSALTDLEHEWTVANINADKKKLDRILADDYVGVTDGRTEGKAEYLKTIKRDTLIQKWNFEDLKVDLNSDRATLTGTLRVEVKNEQGQIQPAAFRFTDKFVWRDGRWQATGSEVKLLKEELTVVSGQWSVASS